MSEVILLVDKCSCCGVIKRGWRLTAWNHIKIDLVACGDCLHLTHATQMQMREDAEFEASIILNPEVWERMISFAKTTK